MLHVYFMRWISPKLNWIQELRCWVRVEAHDSQLFQIARLFEVVWVNGDYEPNWGKEQPVIIMYPSLCSNLKPAQVDGETFPRYLEFKRSFWYFITITRFPRLQGAEVSGVFYIEQTLGWSLNNIWVQDRQNTTRAWAVLRAMIWDIRGDMDIQ